MLPFARGAAVPVNKGPSRMYRCWHHGQNVHLIVRDVERKYGLKFRFRHAGKKVAPATGMQTSSSKPQAARLTYSCSRKHAAQRRPDDRPDPRGRAQDAHAAAALSHVGNGIGRPCHCVGAG